MSDAAGKADDMTIENLPHSAASSPNTISGSPERRTVASYECELTKRCPALVYLGPAKKALEERPKPEITAPTDAIVKMHAANTRALKVIIEA